MFKLNSEVIFQFFIRENLACGMRVNVANRQGVSGQNWIFMPYLDPILGIV